MRSLALWQEFCRQIEEPLFHRTGVLWMARENDPYSVHSTLTLQKLGVRFEKLSRAELEQRYPQIAFGSVTWAILEPDSGALMARRAVQRVVQETRKSGADYLPEAVEPPTVPTGKARLDSLTTRSGRASMLRASSLPVAHGYPSSFPTC